MEEIKFKVTLADGTELDNLSLNGNNFISAKKIEEKVFEDNLNTVEIYDYSTEETQVLNDAVLIQLQKYDKEYWFILAEKTQEEKDREELFAKTDRTMAVQEYNIMMGNLEDPSDEEE